MSDADYKDLALLEAQDAFVRGDWPVGSVVVLDGVVLARGQNRQNTERDVTWHAEFDAMRETECTALRRRWGKDPVSPLS